MVELLDCQVGNHELLPSCLLIDRGFQGTGTKHIVR
jgi:hypothetical protein